MRARRLSFAAEPGDVLAMIGLTGWPSSVYLYALSRNRVPTSPQQWMMAASFATAVVTSVAIWLLGMRSGVTALRQMDRTPS